jgi:hypothetical protein
MLPLFRWRRAPLQVFPNPTLGHVTLTGSALGATIEVRDVLGRTVGRAWADSEGRAALRLPAGLYLVRVETQLVRLVVQ